MNKLILVTCLLGMSTVAQAQVSAADHAAHHPQTPASAAAAPNQLADGEVRKVDLAQNKVTLRHGPIATLDMPAMTMVFQVRDPAVLGDLKVGDKVRFSAEQVDGALVITGLEKAAQ